MTETEASAVGSAAYGEIEELAGALRVSVGMLFRRLKQAEPEGDLTMPETSALSRLDRRGPMTSSDLARQDRISPQSMGVTVAALEERGLIARDRDPRDGRRIMLSLTRGRTAGSAQPARRADRADRAGAG